jgi:hypothetical protein
LLYLQAAARRIERAPEFLHTHVAPAAQVFERFAECLLHLRPQVRGILRIDAFGYVRHQHGRRRGNEHPVGPIVNEPRESAPGLSAE